MKKITIAILILLGSFSMVSAEIGLKVGVSGQMAIFHADGKDQNNQTAGDDVIQKDNATGVAGYTSFFLEKTLPGPLRRLSIGVDYVPSGLDSESVESVKNGRDGQESTDTTKTNKLKVSFEDLTTYYLSLAVTDSIYVKTGIVSVEFITNESMGTDSTYPNATIDGSMMGIGMEKNFDSGMFARVEGTYMEFDNVKMTSLDNTLSMENLEGASAKISIGT
jgi:hypothetical protein